MKKGLRRILLFLLVKLPLALIALSLFLVLVFKWMPVLYTPLMAKRSIEYRADKDFRTRHRWVAIEKISPDLVRAVIASEDNNFGSHDGFEFGEMRKMLREHRKTGKKIRGCSTISQQTAKNVFTFASGKAPMVWVRKAVEAYYTFLIEKVWGKERIMEVYLNVIEYGKGVYGIGAASEKYFGKKPSQLTRTECCRLAAVLPDPLHRNPADPGPYVRRRTAQVSSLIDKIAYPEWVGAEE